MLIGCWSRGRTLMFVLVAFSVFICSTLVGAQGADDVDALTQKVQELDQAGKFADALIVQRRLAAETEKAETARNGRPGTKTASALTALSWYAVLARDFPQALTASTRAYALDPTSLAAESNRAHALLFMGRRTEARPVYFAYKGKPMSLRSDQLWEDAIADDVEALRKAGLRQPALEAINTQLGGKSRVSDADLAQLLGKIQELHRASNYVEAVSLTEKLIALARERHGEKRPEFAMAILWLGFLYEAEGRYADAEPLLKHALAIREAALGPDHAEVANALNNLGGLYRELGRDAEAEPLFKRALAIAEKVFGPDHADVGRYLNNLAEVCRAQGRYTEAEPLYQRALTITEKALGSDHPSVAVRLNNLAFLYKEEGRYAEAEPLFKRAIDIQEKAVGPDHPDVAQDVNNLAELYHDQGRYTEAEPLYQRALAIQEKVLGPDHPYVGKQLNNLAALYRDQGRYTEAEPLYKRAIAIEEKALGPNNPDVGIDLNNLASLYDAQERYAEAEPVYKRALAITENALGPDHPDVGIRLANLADVYRRQARYAEAEALLKRAIAIQQKAFGPEHPDVGTNLNNLARLYQDQGRYTEAEPLVKRALTIHEKALGLEHREVGQDLSILAKLYHDQRRYAEAEKLLQRARTIDERTFGAQHPDVGKDINNLAMLYEDQGRYAEAEPLMRQALAIAEKSFGRDRPSVASALNNLALVYEKQGRYAEAEPLYRRALAITEKSLGADHPDVANWLVNLAYLYRDQGRYAEAEQLHRQALAIDEKTLGPDHPNVGSDRSSLAELYFSQGDWRRAADYWRDSTSLIIRRVERGTLAGEALTGRKKTEAEEVSWQFKDLVKTVNRLPERDEPQLLHDMFETAQWAQSSEAAQSLSQMAVRGAKGDPKLAALVRERQDLVADWQRRDKAHTAAVAQAPDKRNREAEAENAAGLTTIDARIAIIDKEFAAKFLNYATLASAAPLSVEEVQAQLRPDEAMVLFLDTAEWKPTPEETFIWVVTKTDMRWVRSELGTSALTREVSALRCGLDYEGSWLAKDSRCSDLLKVAYSTLNHMRGDPLPFDLVRAHVLYEGLFGQIEDLVKDKRLLIVPSGSLTQLPFEVLVTESPKIALSTSAADYRDVAWLARQHAITVLPAVSSLKAVRELAKESHASDAYIGFGDPLLDGDPTRFRGDALAAKLARDARCPQPPQQVASLSDRGAARTGVRSNGGLVDVADLRSWAPLPETADELCDVAQDLGVDPATHLYIASRATESTIKGLSDDGVLAKYKIVHFATHGAVAGELSGSTEPGLILTPPEEPSETDDGYLSASEIAGLKLDADWVILSACNTAAGEAKGAEALSGLARAFFYAGARSLLVSHWAVSSESTVKLITKAVAELKADPQIGRAEALRRSILSMIDTGKNYEAHPAFWAPFVLVGEGAAAR